MKLYNVEQYYWDSINKTTKNTVTIAYQKPFVIARSIKRMHETDRTKNYPKGTFFKII